MCPFKQGDLVQKIPIPDRPLWFKMGGSVWLVMGTATVTMNGEVEGYSIQVEDPSGKQFWMDAAGFRLLQEG